jgi:hypothetical protein
LKELNWDSRFIGVLGELLVDVYVNYAEIHWASVRDINLITFNIEKL